MSVQSPDRQINETQSASSYHPLDLLHRGVERFVDWMLVMLIAKVFRPRRQNKVYYKPRSRSQTNES